MASVLRILCCAVVVFIVSFLSCEVNCTSDDFVSYEIDNANVEPVRSRSIHLSRSRRGSNPDDTKKYIPKTGDKVPTKPPPVKVGTPSTPKANASTPVPPIFFNASDTSTVHGSSVPVDTVTRSDGIWTDEEDLEKLVESGNVTLPSGYENTTDHHEYYNTTFYSNPEVVKQLWTDLDSLPSEHVITHDMLSKSHRRAATVNLTFDFPFYGHPIRNVTIATGGFLFTGYMLHVWLAATQFIAPLMANFETISSNNSAIKYVDNGTALVVEWQEVVLQDSPAGGNYTFQAVLHKSGDIVFVYKDLPMAVTDIPDKSHPVKVGISDAYMFDRMVFFLKRKTIYEYHRVNHKSSNIKSNTAIYFTALPTCPSLKTCEDCRTAQLRWECLWCDTLQRCSSGVDRHRQSWLENQCDLEDKKSAAQCSAETTPATSNATSSASETTAKAPIVTSTVAPPVPTSSQSESGHQTPAATTRGDQAATTAATLPVTDAASARSQNARATAEDGAVHRSSISSGSVVAIIMILLLIVAVGLWVMYAYRNPQTPAGQFLIKYRPSQWRLHGEARYTAATSVHI
uniref:Putative extracellular protein tem7 n=1 Tax=Ornithodoros turicata TaxID=34597 RepID=A0A2R5LHN2_9ACAR